MRFLHRFALWMSPMGFVAIIAGWVTTEVGRQPWLVYGHLRTSESVSPLGAPAVATSLIAFVVIYFAVFGVGIWYILRLMHRPPEPHEEPLAEVIEGPIRTAGIMPAAQAVADDGAENGE
jgi:cytochrome d ubiquinol oxidase subunit I